MVFPQQRLPTNKTFKSSISMSVLITDSVETDDALVPDDFILHTNDHVAYKQFGNAVNVDVVHFVILNTLKSYNLVPLQKPY